MSSFRKKRALKELMPDKAMQRITDTLTQKGLKPSREENIRGGLAKTFEGPGGKITVKTIKARMGLGVDLEMSGQTKQFDIDAPRELDDIADKAVRAVQSSRRSSMNVKRKLVRLGSENPDLQKHIRPVLDRISSGKTRKESKKSIQGMIMGFLQNIVNQVGKTVNRSGDHDMKITETWAAPGSLGVDFSIERDREGRVTKYFDYTLLFDFQDKSVQLAGMDGNIKEWGYQTSKSEIVRGVVDNVL